MARMMCMVGNLYKAAGLALAQLVKALSILSAYKWHGICS